MGLQQTTTYTAVCLYTTPGRVKAAHCYVVGCAGALPLKDVPLWFLKLVPPPSFTTVARPFTPLELRLEGTGGGILAFPKGEDVGRLLSRVEEDEEEGGGGEEAEVKTTFVLALGVVVGVVAEAVLVLLVWEGDGCLRVAGGELLRFPKS